MLKKYGILIIIGLGVAAYIYMKKSNSMGDLIPGGLADDKSPSDFDPYWLKKGTDVEMEHTSDRRIAQEIAMDHLTEDKMYYKKLAKMESV